MGVHLRQPAATHTAASLLQSLAHVPLLSVTAPVEHGAAHTPPAQRPLQHLSLLMQEPLFGMHPGVEVVLVVVVVVCAWHVPPEQLPLQHCLFFLHFFPSRLHSSSARAIPGMEASVPPRRTAPISLIALPREMLPLSSPLASSSKELSLIPNSSLLALSAALPPVTYRLVREQGGGIWAALSGVDGGSDEQDLALFAKNFGNGEGGGYTGGATSENAVRAKFGIAPLQTARTASEQEERAAR